MSDNFTLEKLKISERLATLEANQSTDGAMIKDIHKAIMGEGEVPGMKIEIDRLKQADQIRKQHGVAIYTTLAGLVIKAVWGFFTGK